MTGRVVVIGDVMTDISVKAAGPLIRGADQTAAIRQGTGGQGYNTAMWSAHFGMGARLVASVGHDRIDRIAADLDAAGVKPSLVRGDRPTGRVVAIVEPDGSRSFFTDRGANAELSHDDLPSGLLDTADHVHVSAYTCTTDPGQAAVRRMAEEARHRDVLFSLDSASHEVVREVGPSALISLVAPAAMIFANEEEAAALTGLGTVADQLAMLGDHFAVAVVKLGAAGASAVAGGQIHRVPAASSDVVDTTGAGDAFAAAFIAAWHRREPPAGCLKVAVDAGSRCVSRLGAAPF